VTNGAQIAVYKMGEKGAITITGDGEITTGIYRTEALKPNRRGRQFHGRLRLGPGRRASVATPCCAARPPPRWWWRARLRAGHANAAELDDFLRDHSGPSAA
jgi:5-dehydro-2-deoxygluconokinase